MHSTETVYSILLYFSLPIRYSFLPSLQSSLGLPGFAQNICSVIIITQDNCIPEILFKT